MIKPVAHLNFLLNSEERAEDMRKLLMLSFQSLAYTEVAVGQPEGYADASEALCVDIKLYKPFWDDGQAGAAEVWQEALLPWVDKRFGLLETTIANFNSNAPAKGYDPIKLDYLVIRLKPYEYGIRIPASQQFPDIGAILDLARKQANGGLFADLDVQRICVGVPVEQPEEVVDAGAEAALAGDGDGQDGAAPLSADEEVAATVDYSVWEVVSGGGQGKLFDSTGCAWID
jgi:hypothetical protein